MCSVDALFHCPGWAVTPRMLPSQEEQAVSDLPESAGQRLDPRGESRSTPGCPVAMGTMLPPSQSRGVETPIVTGAPTVSMGYLRSESPAGTSAEETPPWGGCISPGCPAHPGTCSLTFRSCFSVCLKHIAGACSKGRRSCQEMCWCHPSWRSRGEVRRRPWACSCAWSSALAAEVLGAKQEPCVCRSCWCERC